MQVYPGENEIKYPSSSDAAFTTSTGTPRLPRVPSDPALGPRKDVTSPLLEDNGLPVHANLAAPNVQTHNITPPQGEYVRVRDLVACYWNSMDCVFNFVSCWHAAAVLLASRWLGSAEVLAAHRPRILAHCS